VGIIVEVVDFGCELVMDVGLFVGIILWGYYLQGF
jgi:hypothetical protein